jgi:hypothetical protein
MLNGGNVVDLKVGLEEDWLGKPTSRFVSCEPSGTDIMRASLEEWF